MALAPYRFLYSNDTTHILGCISPYRKADEPFSEKMLLGSIDETAGTGIDAHLIQPGLGWVPLWKSRQYPWSRHVAFIKERFGWNPADYGIANYMAEGGDAVAAMVGRCRLHGLAPFISYRLNDSHGFDQLDQKDPPRHLWLILSPIHVEHPEWQLGPDLKDWDQRGLNWAIPEVRAHKLGFIRELIEGYDLAGFELDFMRHCSLFRQRETTSQQRREIVTAFVTEVRRLLDLQPGPRRHLSVRLPCYRAPHDAIGLDLRRLADAGVDMFNCSPSFFTEQQTDVAAIKAELPDRAVYLEMTHCTNTVKIPGTAYDAYANDHGNRRTTPLQFRTTAHAAFSHGLQGVSLFNFVYYRAHHAPGSAQEPPFSELTDLTSPERCARSPQHWFLGQVWDVPHVPDRALPYWPGRRHAKTGTPLAFHLDLCPPAAGWQQPGILRIQSDQAIIDERWSARLNGVELSSTRQVAEPFPSPYPDQLGLPQQHHAWSVPLDVVKSGRNQLSITRLDGEGEVPLWFIDLAMP